jgi:hypothetical protein
MPKKLSHLSPEERLERRRAQRRESAKRWREKYPGLHNERMKTIYKKTFRSAQARQREYNRRNKDKIRNASLLRNYGITIEEYNEILGQQNFSCGICEKPLNNGTARGHVDHDHSKKIGDPGYVRGILCGQCNVAGGLFRDNAELMRKAIGWFGVFATRRLAVSDLKIEEWKSNQNHQERHFFQPADEHGYQSSRYIWGYNPQVISEKQVKQILEIIAESSDSS